MADQGLSTVFFQDQFFLYPEIANARTLNSPESFLVASYEIIHLRPASRHAQDLFKDLEMGWGEVRPRSSLEIYKISIQDQDAWSNAAQIGQ